MVEKSPTPQQRKIFRAGFGKAFYIGFELVNASLVEILQDLEDLEREVNTGKKSIGDGQKILDLDRKIGLDLNRSFANLFLSAMLGDYYYSLYFNETIKEHINTLNATLKGDSKWATICNNYADSHFNWYTKIKKSKKRLKQHTKTGFSGEGQFMKFPPLLPSMIGYYLEDAKSQTKLIKKFNGMRQKWLDGARHIIFGDGGIRETRNEILSYCTYDDALGELRKGLTDVKNNLNKLIESDIPAYRKKLIGKPMAFNVFQKKIENSPEEVGGWIASLTTDKEEVHSLLEDALNIWFRYKPMILTPYLQICSGAIYKLCSVDMHSEIYPFDKEIG